jgi:putative SOS response-associated peptidase YedK
MCTNYVGTRNKAWVKSTFGVELPETPFPEEAYPGYAAPIVRRNANGEICCELARFGLVPHWSKDMTIGKRTYNARSETVAEKPSYRTPWRKQQFCIALADAIYEPNYESGKAVRWKIQREDLEPMAIASLWDQWTDKSTGEIVVSFTMLTVNADTHPVMRQFHKAEDEKRSVVVLNDLLQWLKQDLNNPIHLLHPPKCRLISSARPSRGSSDFQSAEHPGQMALI